MRAATGGDPNPDADPGGASVGQGERSLAELWAAQADDWIAWSRRPGFDSYWVFHRARFLDLVPDPGRLTVDVGCGEGRVGRDLVAAGHRLVGFDPSRPAIAACASHPDAHPAAVADGTRLPLPAGAADLVVGFMSFHDIDDLTGAITEAARVLDDGGRIHLAIVHPINSAGTWQPADPVGPASGDAPVDASEQSFVIAGSYLDEFSYADRIERDGLAMTFHGRHRPLRAYTAALADVGFVIETLDEVTDESSPTWARLPMFLHLIARRA